MTVLVLMPIAEARGGAEVLLLRLLQSGHGQRVRWVVVFMESGPMIDECEALGVTTHVVSAGRLREGRRWWAAVRAIATVARAEQADLIFSWMAKAHLYGAFAARRVRVPSVWYQHGIPNQHDPLDRLVTMLPAQAVVACSAAAAAAQRDLWPRRQTDVAYPCVDLEQYNPSRLPSPSEARRHLNLPERGQLVGTVGRLQRWKGMHVLISAMPSVLQRHPDTHCVIVGGRHDGEPEYEKELREMVRSLGLEAHVTFAGFQRDVPLWMQAMDVFVHAADREPFGMVVVEAMALGKPVVAGAAGGPREVVLDGETGTLVPFEDVVSLSTSICRYFESPDRGEGTARRAKERAHSFSSTAYSHRLAECLRAYGGGGVPRVSDGDVLVRA